ncbi:LysR family transcriptional regulator [bacterium]|nr:LysR family transcriptional regulator [bacterium]
MTLDQLEMLEAIVLTGSFMQASQKLHKTQPSISVGIKKMEAEYGITLFDRSQYRPTLTQAGKVLFEAARETLASFRRLSCLAEELGKGIETEIRFAIDPLVRVNKIKHVLSLVLKENVNVSLYFNVQVLGDNLSSLLEESYDFAIAQGLQQQKDVQSQLIDTITMEPVISRNGFSQGKIDSENLKKIPQIIVQTQKTGSDMGILSGGKRWYVSEHTLKEEMIREGLGWGHLPAAVLQGRSQLTRISPEIVKPFEIELYIMCNAIHPLGILGKKIWTAFLALV